MRATAGLATVGGAVALFGAWIGHRLLVDRGRLLLRLEALERQLGQARDLAPPGDAPRAGLAIGSAAPDFALPDLTGRQHASTDWRGRRRTLIFFEPTCDFCRQLLPDLARLNAQADGSSPVPTLLSSRDGQETRRLVTQHGLGCAVLVQDDGEVAELFRVPGTPAAYRIDESGRIASHLAVGAREVLALAGRREAGHAAPVASTANEGRSAARATSDAGRGRPIESSPVERHGLTTGMPAPPFTLPSVSGERLSLVSYRGRRVLLVFSDPRCGPCDRVAPALERAHRTSPHLEILMVSRGDLSANRAQIAKHGLTFPVALQRYWEVSRAYGTFATPVAYLIDEQGILLSHAIVDEASILALATRGGQEAAGRESRREPWSGNLDQRVAR